MIYYDRIDVSERINVNKTSAPKECDVCRYWQFLNYCLLIMSVNLSNITMVNIKSSDYRCIITLIRKNETMNLLQNADLTEKNGTLQRNKI